MGCAVLGFLAGGASARAQMVAENELRAAFIYNFLLLVEWPEVARAGKQGFLLCAWGDSALFPELSGLQGRGVGQQSLSVARTESTAALSNCQAVVILQAHQADAVLAALKGRPVLTIGDFEGSVAMGVMIGLTRLETRLAFEVNLEAARAGGLRVSAKLLRLARHVVGH